MVAIILSVSPKAPGMDWLPICTSAPAILKGSVEVFNGVNKTLSQSQ